MPSTLTAFTSGDLVISISGDGDGSGTYGDNAASPITLQEVTTAGSLVGQLVLPQATTVSGTTVESVISGEYGSSSEGLLQLSADGQSLTIAGYGVNAVSFNTGGAGVYGTAALAQSSSLVNASVTPVARVVADINYNAQIDTSTAAYNIYNLNNPRSVATVNGTSFYLSGQGVKGDTTQGVLLGHDGANAATAIDTSTDTREAEIVNGQLYVSRDSTQGTGGTSSIDSYGAALPTGATTPSVLPGIAGSVTLTAAQANSVNASAVGTVVHLSPEEFFFANATTLYVADGGNPKQGGLGDGGLQKWSFNGTAWVLDYTLSQGLNQVADTATSGTTGLIGLTGVVVGGTVQLYATNSTLGDLDQTYLYGITDTLAATTAPADEAFQTLVTAAPDSNIRGVAFAPSATTAPPTATIVTAATPQTAITVTSGSSLTVLAGGVVTSATVLSAGTATVLSGGTDSGGILAHFVTEIVNGAAIGDQIDGTQMLNATGTASNETVYNGGAVDLYAAGATASGITVTDNGILAISGHAIATNTLITSGGLVSLRSADAVLSGSLTFSGPGTLAVSAVTSAGQGVAAVISGFGAGDVIDDLAVGTGATLAIGTSGGNTQATLISGGVSQTYNFAGSIGGSLMAKADGLGGEEIVYVTPTATTSTVSSGMSVPNLTVTSGSMLTVLSGGTITTANILSGGTAIISGTDLNSVLQAGGNETVFGTATGDQVFGTQLVSGATAVVANETVYNGGVVDLYLKGSIGNTLTVSSGGTLNISGNAVAYNTILSGGVLNLQSPKATLSGSLVFSGAATLRESAVLSSGYGALATISNFVAGDVVDLTLVAPGATLSSAVVSGNTVETVGGQSFTFAGLYGGGYFSLMQDGTGGVEIVANAAPCYCPGTLIRTEAGEVAIERLAIGDRVITVAGAAEPIRWIGRRRYAGRFLAGQRHLLPVRIRAGALGDGLPTQDLRVSPKHCLLLDGLLVAAIDLVNGTTVIQETRCQQVEYIHLELARHDVILANGAPAESFVDDDSRGLFQNAADYVGPSAPAEFCAPRVESGFALEAIRGRLAQLAEAA